MAVDMSVDMGVDMDLVDLATDHLLGGERATDTHVKAFGHSDSVQRWFD